MATPQASPCCTTNAEIIVTTTLDGLLSHETSPVVYGWSSIALGFDHLPEVIGRSLDLDVILSFSQMEVPDADEQFWQAQKEVNVALEKLGLYMTHLFQEDQIFLRPE